MADREQYPQAEYKYRYERVEDFVVEIVDGPIQFDYREMRRRAYPDIGDQLDALWKGGAELEAMRAEINAVKLRYPKPGQGQGN